jgi:hypothetical protein
MAIWWKPILGIGDADDLQDAADEPVRTRPHRGLADAELGGDLRERSAPVLLQELDDAAVELAHAITTRRGMVDGVASRSSHLADGSRGGASEQRDSHEEWCQDA